MNLEELQAIETEEGVEFVLKPGKRFRIVGPKSAAQRASTRVAAVRHEVVSLLLERDGPPEEPVVELELAADVPSLALQRDAYVRWFSARTEYYHPTPEQLEKMMAACAEGDELLFDFAHSFSVRRPNGVLVQVDRKGRVTEPSPYSPHRAEVKK